jgi:hypothetical protein
MSSSEFVSQASKNDTQPIDFKGIIFKYDNKTYSSFKFEKIIILKILKAMRFPVSR